MKKYVRSIAIEIAVVATLYILLLHSLAGTNIVAGIFCPGPHLPHYYPVLILLFVISRTYMVLLPGILLARIGLILSKRYQARGTDKYK